MGYVGLGYAQQGGDKIKALYCERVEASPEKALQFSGEYPLSEDYISILMVNPRSGQKAD